ncbi:hypothetical protein [Streptomyces sp. NPDC058548]|uniref:hypothetical protein n=1 Tax=unclassified Streptomyces TaxID=2593676 RepID=UPI003656C120
MSTPISQNFDAARASLQKIADACGEGEGFVRQTRSTIEGLAWSGDARLAFDTVSEQWAEAVLTELKRFSLFADLSAQIVDTQEMAESFRAQGAPPLATEVGRIIEQAKNFLRF